MSSHFRSNETFDVLIEQLAGGGRDIYDPRLTLAVIEYHDRQSGRLVSHSLNNRRLWCLKQYQERVRATGWVVWARVDATNVSGSRHMITCVHHLSLRSEGRAIRVHRSLAHFQ